MVNLLIPAGDAEEQKTQRKRYNKLFGRYLDQPTKLAKFQEYHAANPDVFKLFGRLAQQWRDKGKDRGSAALFGNVIRWQINIHTESDDGFKLSNDWLPLYARLLVLTDQSFEGFFVFHERKPKDKTKVNR